ncbi:MAG: MoaD/ThiS family protein [SAR202 cluster bacterium]|nr:MoaD/ThiS family protein [SAR202 cluster bacterium]
MAVVFIPSLMQNLTKGQSKVVVPGKMVREIINNLDAQYPGMKDRLVDKFRIRSNINVAIDGEITPMGLLGEVKEDSEVHFLPAIGGGALRQTG